MSLDEKDTGLEIKQERFPNKDEKQFIYEVKNNIQAILFICIILNFTTTLTEEFKDPTNISSLVTTLISKNSSFKILYYLLKDKHFTAIVEDKYIDRIYRDSYYTYYSKKHFEYSRYCKRVLIFDGGLENAFLDMSSKDLQKSFKGCFVIRPLNTGAIGRSLLDPFYFKINTEKIYLRKTTYIISSFGKQLSISAFPFSMQDGETTTCAEITILNISDYYSHRYPEYHFILPSDISHIAKKLRFERSLPTHGLQYEIISKVFTETGFSPVLYHEKTKKARKLKHILYYYIESGIPVAIGVKTDNNQKHSIIGIGHGEVHEEQLGTILYPVQESRNSTLFISNTADVVNHFCVIDDNHVPYELLTCKEKEDRYSQLHIGDFELEYLMVPLYKRMLLEAEDAYTVCKSILANKTIGFRKITSLYEEINETIFSQEYIQAVGTREYPLCIRLFMASSKNFRRVRQQQFLGSNKKLLEIYSKIPFSRFIWVCELYTLDSYPKKVIGELIIDATSSAKEMSDSLIMIHYPGYYIIRESDFFIANIDRSSHFHEIKGWVPMDPYTENLSDKS